eukprot:TRINITY_DN6508_c0_g1_i14.p1 TRINITY_DN6508_c0_g1~~TRINITY_DN6508_c0_g1_i14.p1  ORF type:complete len:328 (+),score=39.39 TRINITY_DN6508_c0_g1_i14:25-984(+)
MIRRPPRSTHCISSAASDVYKRQESNNLMAEEESDSSCNCSHDFPKTQKEVLTRLVFISVIMVYAIVLLVEMIYLNTHSSSQRKLQVILIYGAITLAGYISMAFSQTFSLLKQHCWLVAVFRVLHYSVFYWLGILYIFSLMMGRDKYVYVSVGRRGVYRLVRILFRVAAGTGLVALGCLARTTCGTSGQLGFYMGSAMNILTALLLAAILLIKYVVTRIYNYYRYYSYSCYFHMLLSYLAIVSIMGLIYYIGLYRYKRDTLSTLIYYVVYSLIVMIFPVFIVFYLLKKLTDEHIGKLVHNMIAIMESTESTKDSEGSED